ncbi:purine-cytosine permease family protein [Salibacterium aidingense]|uniref:purine-cytosine permease family protein n=1 Tax=Salibacterium aidingense TaxID=384933 RepID=UPI0004229D64|nr:cytosine permease [Salibacterium aidingense]
MSNMDNDTVFTPVPESERSHWLGPATVFGGLEFAVPVIMVGATLAGSFGLLEVFFILLVGLVVVQWIGNALQGYLGAKTGRPASVIARTSFGAIQARFIVGLALVVLNMGWFGINTATAGNAISAVVGIDYNEQWLIWSVLTLIAGVIFSLPAVIGYSSMKWTDYFAVPAGLILIGSGVYFALSTTGWEGIFSWNPDSSMTIYGGISLVLGANVAQWLIASDYTRYSRPTIKDQSLIPLGIVVIGLFFFFTGAVMSVGIGEADIVNVMQELGFPFWGFIILFVALWTSQLVASYSIGLAAANMFNINSGKGRAILTLIGSLFGVLLALIGILNFFQAFLIILAVIYPAIAGIMFADFFFIRKQTWVDKQGWNWIATLSMVIGVGVGYLTQYTFPIGIPAIQSLLISMVVYIAAMKIQAKIKPNHFSELSNSFEKEIDKPVYITKTGEKGRH